MGANSKYITRRFQNAKITIGYCLVCGSYGSLSKDHVPPQGSITITKIEQKHISEIIGVDSPKIKGIASPNGSKFRTICRNCNSTHIGSNDEEVARVCKSLTLKIKDYFTLANSVTQYIQTDVDSMKFARAMIGHILAATSVEECKVEPIRTPYFQPLKDFVLGDDTAIQDTHDIYYWFYPFNNHLSAKCLNFYNRGGLATLSVLSFFPIAFMITKKNEGIYPAHSRKLLLGGDKLTLDLSYNGFEFSAFPFNGLSGNQVMLFNENQAIVSYPIGR